MDDRAEYRVLYEMPVCCRFLREMQFIGRSRRDVPLMPDHGCIYVGTVGIIFYIFVCYTEYNGYNTQQ